MYATGCFKMLYFLLLLSYIVGGLQKDWYHGIIWNSLVSAGANDDDRVAVVVVLLLMVRMAIDINHRLWWNVYIHITYSIYVYVLNLLHACHRHSTEFTRRFIVQWLIKSATQSDCGCLAIHSRPMTCSFVQFSYEYSLYNMPMANPL